MKLNRVINYSFFLFFVAYLALRFYDIWEVFFNAHYAGNDARQQLFPLYTVIRPGIFENDLIFISMKAYMAPIHWYIAAFFTWLCDSPVLAGHCVMVLQLALSLLGVFMAVKNWASVPAAFFSLIWVLHTANLFKNTVGGLPRGWAGAVIGCYLWFISRGNHIAIILCITAGCLLHPPSTFMIAICYSLQLAYGLLRKNTRSANVRPAIMFALAAPLIFIVATQAVSRPPQIGKMVTLHEAAKEPALNRKNGRFPFYPLKRPWQEIKPATLKPFINENVKSSGNMLIFSIIGAFLLLALYQLKARVTIAPSSLYIFLVAVFSSYFIARLFAFRLYVPSRYLSWPFNLFIIVFFSVALWNLLKDRREGKERFAPYAGLLALACLVAALSGSGLTFRRVAVAAAMRQNEMMEWLRSNTAPRSLVAGHPSLIDGVPLYGMRRAYITTETAHPFYDKYWKEVSRRLDNSFRMLYAKDAEQFLRIAQVEQIDYFIFNKKYFTLRKDGSKPTFLKANYFKPQDALVQKLASRPADQYFLRNIMYTKSKAFVYKAKGTYILDVKALLENPVVEQ